MPKEPNILHKKVGKVLKELVAKAPNLTLLLDTACEERAVGNKRIPLFCSPLKSRATEFCNVDMLILKENKVKVIVEIEESNVKPTQVCGKFLTSALAKYFIHETANNRPIEMDAHVTFIQILDTSKLEKEKTKKILQWKELDTAISGVLPLKNSRITTYRILTADGLLELENLIRKAAV